ncbi:MAG: methyltransferase domain-containing protein [Patescibacteria group bacterium]|jgi:SAM-dependent methyltransferase
MKNKLLIVVGESGSGKTQFAKRYAKEHQATYLDFDMLFDYSDTQNACARLIDKLTVIIQNSPGNSFVLDGYIFYNLPSVELSTKQRSHLTIAHLAEKLDADVSLCLCFAAPHILRQRQLAKAKADPLYPPLQKTNAMLKEEIEAKFLGIIVLDPDPILIDTTDPTFPPVTKKTFPQRWQELLLLSDLVDMEHDKFYQDIELPSGVQLKGYSDSAQTWNRLSSIIDFTGKTVLDIGCFHGFFSFKAEEAGAKAVVGIDHSLPSLDIARRIGWLKNARATFHEGDMDDFTVEQPYDIVLVLNVLHHAKNKEQSLQNIFHAGDLIVFEAPMEQKEMISSAAHKFGFALQIQVDSYRLGRGIFVFTNSHSTTRLIDLPPKYQFSIQKYRWHKFIQMIKRFKITYPVRYLVRKYREYRRGRV